MIPSAAWNYWRLNDPFCSDAAVKIANAFEWPDNPQKIAPSPWGSEPPSNIWYLGPTRVFTQNSISIGSAVFAQLMVECPITLQCTAMFLKNASSPRAPSNTWYLGPTQVIIPNNISIGSVVFVWVSNAMLYNALSMWKKTFKITPSLWDFVTLLEQNRAMVIGKMHKKIGKNRACGLGDMLMDRHTHTDVLITILCHCSRGRNN